MNHQGRSVSTQSFPWVIRTSCVIAAVVIGCGDGGKAEPAGGSGGSTGGQGGEAGANVGGSSSSGMGGSGGSGGGGPSASRCLPADYDGPAIYVSLSGNDNNAGTKDAPVKTLAKALAIRAANQDVRVFGGTYTEKLLVAASGTADAPIRVLPVKGEKVVLDATGKAAGKPIDITGAFVHVQGFEAIGSGNQCVDITGSDVVLCNIDAHDCVSHGIQLGGPRIWAEENIIHDTVLENEGAPAGQGWGSGLKVKVGGDDITLYRNRSYHNWGEGVAVTRGTKVVLRENLSYDNFSVNFYIDNSYDVLVEKNMATCVANSGYERDGKRAAAFMIGEEYYDGWGAQLHAVTIRNNIGVFCNRGFLFAGSDVGGGLVDVSIVHNTFWGSEDTAVSIAAGVTSGTVVHNNLVQQPAGEAVWIESL
ncbi:MAG TPA: right-handed parallel beta-helix repeat-containing protein, partial [Polyangium sp.]|nr:right-handed parallel beta-helix repeat-containing protein [Polyangium sp.]